MIASAAESMPVTVASAEERYVISASVDEKLVIVPLVIMASAAESMPVTVASAIYTRQLFYRLYRRTVFERTTGRSTSTRLRPSGAGCLFAVSAQCTTIAC